MLAKDFMVVPILEKWRPVLYILGWRALEHRCVGICIGGGTLVGTKPVPIGLQNLLGKRKLPIFFHGSGVKPGDLDSTWSDLLQRQEIYGGVRGPLSKRRLEESGIQIPFNGDAAVSFDITDLSNGKQSNPGQRIIAFNMGSHFPLKNEASLYGTLGRLVTKLSKEGYRPVFVSLHKRDEQCFETYIAPKWGAKIPLIPSNHPTRIWETLSQASICIGLRLHFVILGHLLGKPTVSVNYAEKHRDFLQSIEASAWGVDLDGFTETAVERLIRAALEIKGPANCAKNPKIEELRARTCSSFFAFCENL